MPRLPRFGIGLIVGLLAGGAGHARGQARQHAGHDWGTLDFPIGCSSQARVEFNRAVALLHHMTYPQAREAFERVTTLDPQCAMAHWGMAMTLFQPLWPTRPRLDERQRGWEEAEKARALAPPTKREQLFVAAVEAFFLEPASPDYWPRIRRWAEAMEKVHVAFPDDPEASAFYALALLATAPSDTISPEHADQAAEILLGLYRRNPDHPGVMHYLVHARDVPGREGESAEIVRKYETIAPSNPHALHMPTHIYTRLGDWDGVIRGNGRAAKAALETPAGDHGEFVWDEFPHAVEYLIYAYLQKGEDDKAAGELERLRTTARLQPTFKTAFHLASTRSRYALEQHDWAAALALVPREPATLDWDLFAWPEAIVHFARGLGAAHLGKLDEAKRAAERLEELETATRKTGEDLFVRNIEMLRLELDAWRAHGAGHEDSSVALMRQGAELEVATPKHAVTPGPTLPAYELLGDLFSEQKHPIDALAAYQRALELYPRRFNSLLGAARAARAVSEGSLTRQYYRQLLDVAAGGTRRTALSEARDYLARGR